MTLIIPRLFISIWLSFLFPNLDSFHWTTPPNPLDS